MSLFSLVPQGYPGDVLPLGESWKFGSDSVAESLGAALPLRACRGSLDFGDLFLPLLFLPLLPAFLLGIGKLSRGPVSRPGRVGPQRTYVLEEIKRALESEPFQDLPPFHQYDH